MCRLIINNYRTQNNVDGEVKERKKEKQERKSQYDMALFHD